MGIMVNLFSGDADCHLAAMFASFRPPQFSEGPSRIRGLDVIRLWYGTCLY